MTEITVITPITACRRLARRYRAATKSSNLTPASRGNSGDSCGDPLEWQRDPWHVGFVFAIALPKSFFQSVFLTPDHQRKRAEGADCQEHKAHQQPATYTPSGQVQQV